MRSLVAAGALGVLLAAGCHRPVLVVGHRGSPEMHPENTLPSFRAAVEEGADWVELDSRLSADGTAFCLHDDMLDRTTDARTVLGGEKIRLSKVRDVDVERLDAGEWFDAQFAGTAIPELRTALDLIQGGATTLLERKDGPAEFYAELLQEQGLVGKLVVQSFDWEFLADLHRLLPEQPLCALGSKWPDEAAWQRLRQTGADYVAWAHQDLDRERIARFHDEGLEVLTYTVNEEDDWRRMIRDGVDGIITNRPGALRRWVGHPHARAAFAHDAKRARAD